MEQGGDDDIGAQLQSILHGPHGLLWPYHKGGGGKEQPQTEQNVPVPLLAQNPTQNYHLPEQSIWLKGEEGCLS